jgi:TatD DNase family protein
MLVIITALEILVVDDVGINRLIPGMILRPFGYEVREVPNGEEAIVQLQSQDLPVLIHAVKVDAELWEVFQAFPSKKWVIHGAMGKWERWKKFVSEGVCFSFGKGLLNDAATQETFRNIPMEQLFLETDAADPNLLESIYRQAAAIKQKEMDVVKQEIWSNFATTFEKYGT